VMQVEEVFLLHWQKLLSLLGWRIIGELSFIKICMVVSLLTIRPELSWINIGCCLCLLNRHAGLLPALVPLPLPR
jgi:hypothetical protein